MKKNMWWGYLHANGLVQTKSWLGDHKDYEEDCYNNPFVQRVVEPFEAVSYEEAKSILERELL